MAPIDRQPGIGGVNNNTTTSATVSPIERLRLGAMSLSEAGG